MEKISFSPSRLGNKLYFSSEKYTNAELHPEHQIPDYRIMYIVIFKNIVNVNLTYMRFHQRLFQPYLENSVSRGR